jgi:NADH:ubiquinone oxidoreductase subunit H
MIILIICIVLKIFAVVVPLLISVAYFTIAERKIMGIIQIRKGPNVIGFLGLLQPMADGLKLLVLFCSHTFIQPIYQRDGILK